MWMISKDTQVFFYRGVDIERETSCLNSTRQYEHKMCSNSEDILPRIRGQKTKIFTKYKYKKSEKTT